jgi:hypothetical protein
LVLYRESRCLCLQKPLAWRGAACVTSLSARASCNPKSIKAIGAKGGRISLDAATFQGSQATLLKVRFATGKQSCMWRYGPASRGTVTHSTTLTTPFAFGVCVPDHAEFFCWNDEFSEHKVDHQNHMAAPCRKAASSTSITCSPVSEPELHRLINLAPWCWWPHAERGCIACCVL